MKPFFLFIILFFLTEQTLVAQDVKQYRVEFKDKSLTHFRLDRPQDFLSSRALQRRKRQQLQVTENDLPVSPIYIRQLEQKGIKVKHTSRWLNSALVIMDETEVKTIAAQPFVKSVTYFGKNFTKKKLPDLSKSKRSIVRKVNKTTYLPNHYGFVEPQISMLNGDFLHQKGYRGDNILVAVMDGGFTNLDQMECFDNLHRRSGIKATYDVVDVDENVLESSTHGSKVLSVMAADTPGLMVGTAPDADYICLKTEDVRGEYRSEEFYWIVGLEYADSIGVDVVNSSLGYATFTDASMNYSYADMDGRSTLASRCSDYAAAAGMIVVNAAGNSGDTDWKYVDTPADGRSVLSVGAVDIHNNRASFSSYGPTADGRVKPDIVALGRRIGVASVFTNNVNASNGTSYSAPLITGLVASLWQAFPQRKNYEIMDAVRQSGTQANQPDDEVGYGLPDFKRAYEILSVTK
ncbi:MAG: S8 family serine peptidase [Saprospiraceae bacterium]